MNKYFLSFAVIFASNISCSSCRMNVLRGEGAITTDNPSVPAFTAVVVDISLKPVINVQAGTQPGIEIKGYENLLKHIKTKVEGNTLTIYTDLDETWMIESGDVIAQVTLPVLTRLTLNGSSDAEVHGTAGGSDLKIDIAGSGDVKIDNVAVDNFTVVISGSGSAEVKGGNVKYAEYRVAGSGDVNAQLLQADEAKATVAGSGDIAVNALQKLDANIGGSGSIKYKGHPALTQVVSGSGSISEAR